MRPNSTQTLSPPALTVFASTDLPVRISLYTLDGNELLWTSIVDHTRPVIPATGVPARIEVCYVGGDVDVVSAQP